MESTAAELPSSAWSLDVEPAQHSAETVLDVPALALEKSVENRHELAEETAPPPLEQILEGLFFIAENALPAERIGQVIRGLSEEHLLESVRRINARYRQEGRPYWIERQPDGFCLKLRSRFQSVLEPLKGTVKEVRLSAGAVETLSVIAYRQPISKARLEGIRGQACDGPLRQLIRRGLVQLKHNDSEQESVYLTTPRFLEFFQLHKLEELPRADDLDRL